MRHTAPGGRCSFVQEAGGEERGSREEQLRDGFPLSFMGGGARAFKDLIWVFCSFPRNQSVV